MSINTCIGADLFKTLDLFCAITGQSKTVAVERAIEAYCKSNNTMVDMGNVSEDAEVENKE